MWLVLRIYWQTHSLNCKKKKDSGGIERLVIQLGSCSHERLNKAKAKNDVFLFLSSSLSLFSKENNEIAVKISPSARINWLQRGSTSTKQQITSYVSTSNRRSIFQYQMIKWLCGTKLKTGQIFLHNWEIFFKNQLDGKRFDHGEMWTEVISATKRLAGNIRPLWINISRNGIVKEIQKLSSEIFKIQSHRRTRDIQTIKIQEEIEKKNEMKSTEMIPINGWTLRESTPTPTRTA